MPMESMSDNVFRYTTCHGGELPCACVGSSQLPLAAYCNLLKNQHKPHISILNHNHYTVEGWMTRMPRPAYS